jgi:hypothetical protein
MLVSLLFGGILRRSARKTQREFINSVLDALLGKTTSTQAPAANGEALAKRPGPSSPPERRLSVRLAPGTERFEVSASRIRRLLRHSASSGRLGVEQVATSLILAALCRPPLRSEPPPAADLPRASLPGWRHGVPSHVGEPQQHRVPVFKPLSSPTRLTSWTSSLSRSSILRITQDILCAVGST